jgi:hypothetical protein
MKKAAISIGITVLFLLGARFASPSGGLEPLKYNHPGLLVDLGVGLWAWPLPMDFNGNGLTDMVVVCTDVPYNGVYCLKILVCLTRIRVCRFFYLPNALAGPSTMQLFLMSMANQSLPHQVIGIPTSKLRLSKTRLPSQPLPPM